jgi:2-dehydropantoate 2-reductase
MVKEKALNDKEVVIIGPGAVGSAVAASFATQNFSFKLLGRERHKDFFTSNPVVYKKQSEILKEKIDCIILEDLENYQSPPAAIFIALKANQTMPMIKQLESFLPAATPIISLQNGIIAEEIARKSNFENVFACVIGFNLKTEKLGIVLQTSEGDIKTGRVSVNGGKVGKSSIPKFIITMLNSLAPTAVSENIQGDVWMKVIINSTINPLCAIGDMPLGELAAHHESKMLSLFTWRELVNVAIAENVHLNPFQGKLPAEALYVYDFISYSIASSVLERVVAPHRNALPSMLQDIRNGKKTEIDFLSGKLLEIGQKHQLEMPVTNLIISTIKTLESNGKKPSLGLIKRLNREAMKEQS